MDIQKMEAHIYPVIQHADPHSPYCSLCEYVGYSTLTQCLHFLIHSLPHGHVSEYFEQIEMFSLDDMIYGITNNALNEIGSLSSEPEDPMASIINHNREEAGRVLFDYLFRQYFNIIHPLHELIINSKVRYVDYHVSEADDRIVVRLLRENSNVV